MKFDMTVVLLAVISTVSPMLMAWVAYKLKRKADEYLAQLAETAAVATKQADVAAAKVEEVKQVLEENTAITDRKLNGLALVAMATHAFVNQKMGEVLLKYAQALSKEADRTKVLADREAADRAMIDYQSHVTAQSAVDQMPGTDLQKKGRES